MSMGFRATPSFNTLSPGQLVLNAYEQPMSMGSTFVDQIGGGALESYGLGTFLRRSALPEEAPTQPGLMLQPEDGSAPVQVPDTPQMRRRATAMGYQDRLRAENSQEFQRRRADAGAMSQEEYIASPWYRNNIPYDAGMTRDRAAVLAAWDDAKKVRQFYAEKRPIAAFFGNLVGQAFDPINYVPIAGPAVKAAAVARLGRVGGTAAAASLDAAANTAIFGLATADAREQLGDDVSWQALTTDIAMAALIGGAFGTVGGVLGRRADARLEATTRDQLSTLRNVQEARIALNEAIDGLVTEGEVKLSPNALEPVARMVDEVAPRFAIEDIARSMDVAAFERLDVLNRTFEINTAEIGRLMGQTLDNERFGPTRAAMIEADRLAERLGKAETAIEKAGSDVERAKAVERRDNIRSDIRRVLDGIDDNVVREIETIDESLRARRAANEPVSVERAALQQQIEALRAEARQTYWARESEVFRVRGNASGPQILPSEGTVASPPAARAVPVDASRPRPETPPAGRAEAEHAVGRPDDYKALAQQYRVDPETGTFVEEADIAQLDLEGRLTDADRQALASAQSTFDDGVAYGEALKAAVACLI